jgi:hypothetical protein
VRGKPGRPPAGEGEIDGDATYGSACREERRDDDEDGQGRIGQGSGWAEEGCGAQAYQAAEAALKAHNEGGCIAALKQAQAALH